jgi:hypothetical protein
VCHGGETGDQPALATNDKAAARKAPDSSTRYWYHVSDYEEVATNRSQTLLEVRFMKNLILFSMLALMLPVTTEGGESVPIYTWDRGLTVTPNTLYQYFGFCSGPDCSQMRKPESLGSAPFSVIPYTSIKRPFIVKTPFVMPNEKGSDIWKGLAAFVEQFRNKQ